MPMYVWIRNRIDLASINKWNPEKKQGKEKVEAVVGEHKTQVAVNNHGKTNEATKHIKEPLKSGP